jgi:hypothetical protein
LLLLLRRARAWMVLVDCGMNGRREQAKGRRAGARLHTQKVELSARAEKSRDVAGARVRVQ